MGNNSLTSGERTGLVVLAIVLTAIVALTSLDFSTGEPATLPATQADTVATAPAPDSAAPTPAKPRTIRRTPRKRRAEPARRNPRSERVDGGFADNAENN